MSSQSHPSLDSIVLLPAVTMVRVDGTFENETSIVNPSNHDQPLDRDYPSYLVMDLYGDGAYGIIGTTFNLTDGKPLGDYGYAVILPNGVPSLPTRTNLYNIDDALVELLKAWTRYNV